MNIWDLVDLGMKHIPGFFIIRFFLKKIGIWKDFETVYKTEDKVKSFGNALRRIGVPFYDVVKISKTKIPFIILFRQKVDEATSSKKLHDLGFVSVDKSMGLYLLPPLKIVENGIENGTELQNWITKEFGLVENSRTNIRFAILTDTDNIFTYRHKSLETNTILEALEPHLFAYLKNPIKFTIDGYKSMGRVITEKQIVDATPLQHIFENQVDNKTFEKIQENENSMLGDLLEKGEILDKSYLSVSKVDKDALKDCFIKFIGNINDLDAKISEAIDMSKFIANKL